MTLYIQKKIQTRHQRSNKCHHRLNFASWKLFKLVQITYLLMNGHRSELSFWWMPTGMNISRMVVRSYYTVFCNWWLSSKQWSEVRFVYKKCYLRSEKRCLPQVDYYSVLPTETSTSPHCNFLDFWDVKPSCPSSCDCPQDDLTLKQKYFSAQTVI